MRVHVDPDVCQGHGLCELSAPGVFHLREEDGQSYVLSEEVSPQEEANVRLAAREGCARSAEDEKKRETDDEKAMAHLEGPPRGLFGKPALFRAGNSRADKPLVSRGTRR